MIIALINDFKSSIKSPDTEEKLDLVLYRPLGYLIAKAANNFGMTPSMLSLFGLVFGLYASYLFIDITSTAVLIWASFYFILSGILDSSDGQLARISNQATKFGLILDGICDSLVIIAIYIACSWHFIRIYGPSFSLVVLMALYLHSCQCAILDFYHREYLFFGYGKVESDTYWNHGITDGKLIVEQSISLIDKIMNQLRLGWIKKQQVLTTRSNAQREYMRSYLLNCNEKDKEHFMETYKRYNLRLLPYWRLVGVNAHTIAIIAFMFMRRFDIFLVVFDLIGFNLIILVVSYWQKKSDEKMYTELFIV
jgi:hypothetical protein